MDNYSKELLHLLGFLHVERELMKEEVLTDFKDFLSTTHEELDYMISAFMKRQNNQIKIKIKSPK